MRPRRHYGNRYDDLILSTRDLRLYIPGGEFKGTRAADLSNNRLDGVYTGGFTLGKSGVDQNCAACLLNGTTGYVRVTNNSKFDTGDTLSVEMWIKRTTITTSQVLWDKSANSLTLALDGAGATQDQITVNKDSAGAIVKSTVTLTDTTSFHHIGVAKNGATSTIIVLDGKDVSGTVTNATIANTVGDIGIGANDPSNGASFFTAATLARVAYYGRALSAGEFRERYVVALGG